MRRGAIVSCAYNRTCIRGLSQGVGVQPLLALAGRHLPQGVDGGAMGGRAWAMGLFLTIFISSPEVGPAGLGVGSGGVLEWGRGLRV